MTVEIRKPEESLAQKELDALKSIFEQTETGLIPHLSTSRRDQDVTYLLVDEGEIIGGTTYSVDTFRGERRLTHRAIAIDQRYEGEIDKLYIQLCFELLNDVGESIDVVRIIGYPKEKVGIFIGNGFNLEERSGTDRSAFILRKKLH